MENAGKTITPGQAYNVVELVSCQAGAVVSREIIRRDTGTVTVFAFDKGQGLSEHTAPFDALVQVLEGSVRITIAGAPHDLGAGHMIIMPANKPHALQALTQMKMLLVLIRS
jgi:quercetin dioxygenase-like cupin family protein